MCKRESNAPQALVQPLSVFSHRAIPLTCGALAGAPFPAHARSTRPPLSLRCLYAQVPRAVFAIELSIASAFVPARSDERAHTLLVPRALARHLGWTRSRALKVEHACPRPQSGMAEMLQNLEEIGIRGVSRITPRSKTGEKTGEVLAAVPRAG